MGDKKMLWVVLEVDYNTWIEFSLALSKWRRKVNNAAPQFLVLILECIITSQRVLVVPVFSMFSLSFLLCRSCSIGPRSFLRRNCSRGVHSVYLQEEISSISPMQLSLTGLLFSFLIKNQFLFPGFKPVHCIGFYSAQFGSVENFGWPSSGESSSSPLSPFTSLVSGLPQSPQHSPYCLPIFEVQISDIKLCSPSAAPLSVPGLLLFAFFSTPIQFQKCSFWSCPIRAVPTSYGESTLLKEKQLLTPVHPILTFYFLYTKFISQCSFTPLSPT